MRQQGQVATCAAAGAPCWRSTHQQVGEATS